MKIKVANLGRIKSIELDLNKNLTLLTGQNNSGKTWLSYLVIAVYEALKKIEFFKLPEDKFEDFQKTGITKFDLLKTLMDRRTFINKSLEKETKKLLPVIFKAPKELFDKVKLEIDLNFEKIQQKLYQKKVKSRLKLGEELLIEFVKETNKKTITISSIILNNNEENQFPGKDFFKIIFPSFFSQDIMGSVFNKIHFMPAERIAINIFSKEMSLKRNQIIDELQSLVINKKSKHLQPDYMLNRHASRYPQPIADALRIAEDLGELKKQKSDFSWLADEIEKTILNGKISVSKDGDFEFKPKARGSAKIGIHLTGSVVKTFASLAFYFRHLARKNDFLIIDEPEINLHPDNQVIIAKILAKIINAGFKLMISTHSEYLIKELNYLICMKSNQKAFKALSKKYGYENEMLLDSSQINVYLLKDNGKTKQISVDNSGFEVDTIDKVINSQAEKALAIDGWLD